MHADRWGHYGKGGHCPGTHKKSINNRGCLFPCHNAGQNLAEPHNIQSHSLVPCQSCSKLSVSLMFMRHLHALEYAKHLNKADTRPVMQCVRLVYVVRTWINDVKHFTIFGCSRFSRILTSLRQSCRAFPSIMSKMATCTCHIWSQTVWNTCWQDTVWYVC